jgi:hypothetical protein
VRIDIMEIPKEYKDDPKYVDYLQDVINDLTLVVEMYIDKYPFDGHHRIKQKRLVSYACQLIGKPRTITELKKMLKIREKERGEKTGTITGSGNNHDNRV